VNAGALVGTLAGLLDGLVNAFGIDAASFLLRAQANGWVDALFGGLPRWGGFGWCLTLFGCIAGSALAYGALGIGLGLASGLVLHPFMRRTGLAWRSRTLLGLAFGAWIFGEVYWWTRAVVFSGLPATDPRRLASAGAMLVGGLAAGFFVARQGRRVPRGVRQAMPFVILGLMLVGGLFLLATSAGSRWRGTLNERNRELPNVVIFVVDALRQDVLGCYGAEHVRTPVMDSLAERGVVFEDAYVQAPFTWTSFGSILTGKYPRRHGLVRMAPDVRMAPNVTLPFHLKGATRADGVRLEDGDYVAVAFMTGTLSRESGLLRGFDVYSGAQEGRALADVHNPWSEFRSRLVLWQITNKVSQRFDNQIVASTARKWFASNADRRFVALVHYYSTHTPYDPPEPFRGDYVDPAYDGPVTSFRAEHRQAIESGAYAPTPADERRIRELYYAGVAQADAMIGEVLDELERQGVLDDTIVVVTSDHGEELGDHGLWEHNFMYQTNLRIPLIIAAPGRLPAGRRVSALVDSIDIVPTLCDLIGVGPPSDPQLGERGLVDGRSLLPLVRGDVEAVREFSFAENGRFLSIQDAGRKLIVRRAVLEPGGWDKVLAGELEQPRLFDLAADPGEMRNVYGERAEDALELFTALAEWSASMPIGEHMLIQSARDRQTELFNALGYGGGIGEGLDDD